MIISVICICHNHEKFVRQALESVPTGKNWQLIITDSGSRDGSRGVIADFLKSRPDVLFIPHKKNIGNCRAFNRALEFAEGEWIIDLAGDDFLLPEAGRILENFVPKCEPETALIYAQCWHIGETGDFIKNHYPADYQEDKENIFVKLLQRNFICTPGVIFRKSALLAAGGYDESLSFEDYDIFLRLARRHSFQYLDKAAVAKRRLKNSHGSGFYRPRYNPHLRSLVRIYRKIFDKKLSREECRAVAGSLRYHFRLAVFTENFLSALAFARLSGKCEKPGPLVRFLLFLTKNKIRLFPFFRLYLRLRHGIEAPKLQKMHENRGKSR